MATERTTPAGPDPRRVRRLVERLRGRASARLELDPEGGGDTALGRWLVAAYLLTAVRDEARAERAFRALREEGLADPAALAAADGGPERAARALARADQPRAELHAARLARVSRALAERFDGSLERLAAGSEGLEDLGARLARLGPGIGVSTVRRFLGELRQRWPAAGDVPLSRAACAAAVHLGLLREDDDPESAPDALRSALAGIPDAPPFPDVEAALHRLGTRACLRGRTARCPLGGDCPARTSA